MKIISPNKLIKMSMVGLMTLGVMGSLMNNAGASHRRKIRTHRHTKRNSKNRYGTWRSYRRHGHVHYYWHRYKTGYYHHGHWVSYRRFRRHPRRRTRVSVRKAEPEVDQNQDIDSMDNVTQMEYQTIKMINADRAKHGLARLKPTIRLRHLARRRAQQTADLDRLTHKDQKGRNYYEVDAHKMKIHLGAYSGENLAGAGLGAIQMDSNPHVYVNKSGKDMANMDEDEMVYHDGDSHWGHRYNTLNSHYVKMGIGARQRSGTNNYYVAENFSS